MQIERILENGCDRDWETVAPDEVDPIRFAVIGLGWFTRGRALPALEASDRCEPTVLVSGSPEKAERLVNETNGATRSITYDAFHDGVAVDDYDAVYIVTPNALHLEYAETAAEQGKHVLCEKPIERSSDRGRELTSVCADAGVELMIAYRMHTEPAVRRARELIDAGYVGTPMAVDGEMTQRLLDRIDPNPNQWRLNEALAGGGALFDIGIYPLNTARFLLGSDPIAVTGTTASTHDAFSGVDETVSFGLRFSDGVTGRCYASHNARQSSSITVIGTEGRVSVEPAFFQDQSRALEISRGDGRARIEFDPVDQMLEEFDYFADRIRGQNAIYPDGEHGVVDMALMEAIYEGAATDRWVTVE